MATSGLARRLTAATAEDIGQAVVFLCRADNITGESINVTGGSEMG